MGSMKLSLLFLQFKLHLLNVLLHTFHFKVIALELALDLTLRASLFLQVLGELNEGLVFLKFDGVTFASKLCCLGVQLLFLAFVAI